jgi:hypothetical protein
MAVTGWNAIQALPVGFVIIDVNNNQQTVTMAGITGAGQPAWSSTANGTTTDGTVIWECLALNTGAYSTPPVSPEPTWATQIGAITVDNFVIWQMIAPPAQPVRSSPHRIGGNNTINVDPTVAITSTSVPIVPRYPFYRTNDPAICKTPSGINEGEWTIWGTGNQWQATTYTNGHGPIPNYGFTSQTPSQYPATDAGGNPLPTQGIGMAGGSWVYSISVNRSSGIAGKIPVTLGCMRNGSFVAFGTGVFETGSTNIVLWPIFTSDALVYQAAEAVEIHAVVIGRGGAGVNVGLADVNPPIAAAYYTDTAAMLDLT